MATNLALDNELLDEAATAFLLCAVAERYRFPILTADKDFVKFERVLPLRLHAQQT